MKRWLKEASDEVLKKAVSGLIAILALVVWLAFAKPGPQDDCTYNCVTDISSKRR
jgi:hypothetical protein